MKTNLITLTLIALLTIVSCESNNEPVTTEQPKSSSVQFALVDDPAEYDAVLIDVVGLEYRHESDTSDEDSEEDSTENDQSWVSVDIEPQVYDLLALNNGSEAILANVEMSSGELAEVRLILGENNQLVIDEDTVALTVPSGSASGLKIKIESNIEEDKDYKLILDFDAAKSVVEAGKSGKFLLKPVISATFVELDESDYGAISGVIAPDTVSSVVYVIDEDEDSVSTMPEANGYFLVETLKEGAYVVVAVPSDSSGFSSVEVPDVLVMPGTVTELDTLKFEN